MQEFSQRVGCYSPFPFRTGIMLGVAILSFAAIPVLLKYFTRTVDAYTANGLRYSFAAFIWFPYVLRHHREAPAGRCIWKDALIPAGVSLVAQTLWALSPYYNEAAIMSFVVRSSFLFALLFSLMFLREERGLAQRAGFWVSVGMIALGVWALYGGGLHWGASTPFGFALLIATAAAWGLYATVIRRIMRGYSARLSLGVISLYVSAGLLVIMLLAGDVSRAAALSPGDWALLLLSSFLGIGLGHVLYYRAIHDIGPIATEGAYSLIPFAAAFYAFLFLGERLSALQWAGGFLLVAACLVLVRLKARLQAVHQPA